MPAFARGESAGSQTAQLLKLLDTYGAAELRTASGKQSSATHHVLLRWRSS